MFRKVLLTIGLLIAAQVAVLAQGTLRGTITDEKTGEGIAFANVVAKQDGQVIGGARTDFDGNYSIKGLQVGQYDIEVSFVGYATVKTKIDVKASGFTVYNEQLATAGKTLETVVVKEQKVPVIEIGTPESGQRISSEDIGHMPGNSVESIVSAVAGVGYSDGGTSTARGEDNMVTMQGGVRKRTGVNVPKEAIAEIQVILGGTPANIGEAIGGTQIITLKPPSSNFKGLVKYETYLDYRLSNNLVMYLTGPVFKKRERDSEGNVTSEKTAVGFRLTANGSYSKFGYYRPKDGRYQVVNDDKVMEIEAQPLRMNPLTGEINYSADYLRSSDFVTIKRPTARNYYSSSDRESNFRSYSIALEGALDFRFSDYSTLTLTGEYGTNYAPNTSYSYFPLNLHSAANGVSRTQNIVVQADFTHRFKDPEVQQDATNPDEKIEPAVSKVMLNVSAMYNRYTRNRFNENFGDDVFRYGHVGRFETSVTPSYALQTDYKYDGTIVPAYVQNSWRTNIESFTPSEYNPILANYTSQLYTLGLTDVYSMMGVLNFDVIRQYKGIVNGGSPTTDNGLFSNVGVQSTTYDKMANNYIFAQVKASASIFGHDIEIGYQYDRVSQSYYSLAPRSLWTIMRQNANAHITQLDKNSPTYRYEGSVLYVDYDRLNGGGQTHFSEAMRQALGYDVNGTDWLDIDRYMPDWYKEHGGLDMFSTSELFNSGNTIVSFYGYDHKGNPYKNSAWDLDDFFDPASKSHPNEQYLPSFSPVYMAGYIQDKFYFQDLIFNVGVRVDRFDAGQWVLKDPYLFYESYNLDQIKNQHINVNTGLGYDADGNPIFPNFSASEGEQIIPYVDNLNYDPVSKNLLVTPTILGYRKGSVWYDANGVEISNPTSISGESGKPTPFRTFDGNYVATIGNTSGNKISQDAFEDYDPQWVPMPRIAFSFPVNDASQFKASYDIIARRPSTGWQADYLSYLNINQIGSSVINNPRLKPEKITNYELGFQQALNKEKTAAISISAYYKETRDLIQIAQYAGADPQTYFSYDNIDFKTIKGFSLSFDMRKSKNMRINANYTLQYAEGTGLSTNTMTELIRDGYTTLKVLNPISDDRRHEFKANVDYRLGDKQGIKINRTVKDKDGNARQKPYYMFSNFGVNFLAVAQSGRPYTKAYSNTQSTIVGSVRGARMPWGFYFNVVVDKTWPIDVKVSKTGKTRKTFLNAAVTVNNLFDIRNTVGVFSVTGNATDNGYLTDPETQNLIDAHVDPASFRDLYGIYLSNNYWNYSSPRTVKVSLSYNF